MPQTQVCLVRTLKFTNTKLVSWGCLILCWGLCTRSTQSHIPGVPACSADCTQSAKIKSCLVVTSITRVFCRPNQVTLLSANPCSPVLLTWFGSEQSQGDQIWLQHCKWTWCMKGMTRAGKQQTILTPFLPMWNMSLNNIPVNTVS